MDALIKLLGGPRVLGKVRDQAALERRVQTGLPFAALEALARAVKLDADQLQSVVGIPARTLARRKSANVIPFEEADRVLGIAAVFARASDVLGGVDQARQWMQSPNPALGGVAPLRRLAGTLGRRAVTDEINRIAYGFLA